MLDGRKLAAVPEVFRPKHRVTNATVRRTVEAFWRNGNSTHSKNATLLPYVLDFCHRQGIGYRLYFMPGGGYYIEKTT